jgi:DNA-binding transcriptional MerR regulator
MSGKEYCLNPRENHLVIEYNEEDVRRLKFIHLSKGHGFSLQEIKELLDLRIDSKSSCDEVRTLSKKRLR